MESGKTALPASSRITRETVSSTKRKNAPQHFSLQPPSWPKKWTSHVQHSIATSGEPLTWSSTKTVCVTGPRVDRAPISEVIGHSRMKKKRSHVQTMKKASGSRWRRLRDWSITRRRHVWWKSDAFVHSILKVVETANHKLSWKREIIPIVQQPPWHHPLFLEVIYIVDYIVVKFYYKELHIVNSPITDTFDYKFF